MTGRCNCRGEHRRRRIVLTGGPGAGKTAVLELLKTSLCQHVVVLPESAGIVFGGGFPRHQNAGVKRAAQRAIYHVQFELEAAADAEDHRIVLCDRGTVDGVAYWPGPDDFWSAVGTKRDHALGRYDAVVHLRVPAAGDGYGHQNPLRVETPEQAREIDERILHAWEGHPHRYIVSASSDFITKAERALAILRQELPECCRDHTVHAWRVSTKHPEATAALD